MIPELFTSWLFWYVVGGTLVVIAAALLIAILVVARGIEREAGRALAAARAIESNTRIIWALAGADEALEAIRDAAESIAAKGEHLLGALHGEAGARREG